MKRNRRQTLGMLRSDTGEVVAIKHSAIANKLQDDEKLIEHLRVRLNAAESECARRGAELATLNRCLLTSHMGSMSQDCRSSMELEAVEEVVRFLNRKPLRHPVPESEYVLARV